MYTNGSAIKLSKNSRLYIQNSLFENNLASYGGSIYMSDNSMLETLKCDFGYN